MLVFTTNKLWCHFWLKIFVKVSVGTPRETSAGALGSMIYACTIEPILGFFFSFLLSVYTKPRYYGNYQNTSNPPPPNINWLLPIQ